MSIILYVIVLINILFITSITIANPNHKINKNNTEQEEILTVNSYRTPKVKIILISLFLSTYSAYLGVADKLVDTERYAWSFLYRYPAYNGSLETMLSSGTEPSFLLLNLVMGELTTNPFWLFFIIALITNYINLYCLFKTNKNYVTLILIYLISIYFFQTTYLLKQTIAVSLGNMAFYYLIQNNKKKYFVYSILATSFHSTALILFPMYFVYKKTNSKIKISLLLVTFVLFFVMFDSVIKNVLPNLPYINQYIPIEDIDFGMKSFASIFKGIPYYIISIISLVNRKKIRLSLKNADIYIISSLLYSMSWLLTYNYYWSSRIGWYFLLPTIILIPHLLKVSKNKLLIMFLIYSSLIIVTFRQIAVTIL